MDSMEPFRTTIEIQNLDRRGPARSLPDTLVDALIRAGGSEAPELVVFAEPGDMSLLGAHALEGLNLKIDPVRKALVPAGPAITAGAV
jgi:hypothetical protein